MKELPQAPEGGSAFHEAIAKAKAADPISGPAVTLYSPEDYASMRTFLTDDGSAGFAIKPDGDIISVFNTVGGPHRRIGPDMIQLAVQMGGRKLDAFDTVLPDLYSKAGFRAVARTRFSDEFAPEGWDRAAMQRFNKGRPDIVFMVWDPKHKERYNPGDGRVFASYEDAAAAQAVEADRIWAQEQRAKRKPKKKLADGGRVKLDSSDRGLHEYLMATVAPPAPQRFAMGGAVFPSIVEPRIGALSRRH
ncbi:MAG: hypothetical protein RLZZ403_992 [Pseudomonadota bacterium]|jgi:hypothetical protein